MNRDEVIAAISVMQAWVDGKQIQGKYPGLGWQDFEPHHSSKWSWGEWDFRIKPSPRVFYFGEFSDGSLTPKPLTRTERMEVEKSRVLSSMRTVKFVEVLP